MSRAFEAVRQYLDERMVCVVEYNGGIKAPLAQALTAFGIKPHLLLYASSFEELSAVVERSDSVAIWSDYRVQGECAIGFFEALRARYPDAQKNFLSIVVADSVQQEVAENFELSVDQVLWKPFLPESLLVDEITDAVSQKVRPRAYLRELDAAVQLVRAGQWDQARGSLEQVVGMDAKPSLAYYYLGKVELEQRNYDRAREAFQRGLTYRPGHQPCLHGLFEVLTAQGFGKQAYSLIKQIRGGSPLRLAAEFESAVKLAVRTEQYDDLLEYHTEYVENRERWPAAIQDLMLAAMSVATRYFYKNARIENAQAAAQKLLFLCHGRPKGLIDLAMILNEYGEAEGLKRVLERIPPELQVTDAYRQLEAALRRG